jgi:outer membrane usher protein
MHVRLEDGSELPAGAQVRAEGSDAPYIAVSGGEVYIPELRGVVVIRASWAGRSCQFTATVPEDGDLQPRLDNLVCRAEPHYATR